MVTIIISSILYFQSLIYVRVAGIYLFQFPRIVFWGFLELEGGDVMQPSGAFFLKPTERGSDGRVRKSGFMAQLLLASGATFGGTSSL